MEPNAQGEMVEKRIVRISGPPLPGIETPYIDPSVPDVLKRYSLTDILNQPVKPVEKLWGNYWQTGQLCILAGDMGTGKSTLAIRLARAVAEGQPYLGQRENESESEEITHPVTPQACHPTGATASTGSQEGINPDDKCRDAGAKVLFIGFELGAAEMRMRYGEGEVPDNFFYANISADAFASGRATLGERLVASVDKMVEETEAEVVIIDQPDRMHLQPAMWNLLMLKLNALKVSRGVSVLITLNNKPRNLSKAPTISSIYKSNLLAPHADSIVAIANHCRAQGKRYIKLLKNTAQPIDLNALPEVLEIVVKNNYPDIHRRDTQKTTTDDECQGSQKAKISLQPPTILSVQACGTEREEKVLLPTATERRNMRMIEAEEMRRQGMSFRDIARRMELPERTVRSWVSFIGARDEGRGASENSTHPVTLLACHPTDAVVSTTSPTLGGEFDDDVIPSPVFRQGESHPLTERDLLKVSLIEGVPECNEGEGGE